MLNGPHSEAPTISLDYAIAEKASNMVCIPLTMAWSDVGSWSALWNFLEKDVFGNVVRGDGDIILEAAKNNFAYSNHACVRFNRRRRASGGGDGGCRPGGLEGARRTGQAGRRISEGNGYDLTVRAQSGTRPWGWYQCLNRGDRYQVKCIMVKPGVNSHCRAIITALSIGSWSAVR